MKSLCLKRVASQTRLVFSGQLAPVLLLVSCALFWLASTVPVQGARPTLNLFIWSEYISPAVVADFEKRFDCRVTVDLYEDAESMMAKVQAGGVSMYDIVVPPDHLVKAMVKLKLLAPLRHTNLPNLANLEAQFRNPPYDPANEYTVAYQWGTVGLYARAVNGRELPRSWGLLFDPKLQAGPFVLIDSVRDLMGAALKYKGHSLNSVDPAALKEARDLIIAAKRRAVGFEGSVGARNRVLAKSAAAAIVYSGEGVRGMNEDKQTVYFIPKEGRQIWVDNLAVLAKAPHRDLAETFINFILDAKVGAEISNFTQYSTPNKASKAFIRPADLQNERMYPPEQLKARLEFLQDLGGKTRLYDEIWTQIKAK